MRNNFCTNEVERPFWFAPRLEKINWVFVLPINYFPCLYGENFVSPQRHIELKSNLRQTGQSSDSKTIAHPMIGC